MCCVHVHALFNKKSPRLSLHHLHEAGFWNLCVSSFAKIVISPVAVSSKILKYVKRPAAFLRFPFTGTMCSVLSVPAAACPVQWQMCRYVLTGSLVGKVAPFVDVMC